MANQKRKSGNKGPRPVDAPPGAAPLTSVDEKIDEAVAGIRDELTAFKGEVTEAFREMTAQVAEAIIKQEERTRVSIETVAQAMPVPAKPAAPPEAETAERKEGEQFLAQLQSSLPENVVRFMSPIMSYKLVTRQGSTVIVDNRPVAVPQKQVEFHNGIFDVDVSTDEGKAVYELLVKHPDYGQDFVVDPTALPRSNVRVVDGARSVGDTRQGRAQPDGAVLSAPIG